MSIQNPNNLEIERKFLPGLSVGEFFALPDIEYGKAPSEIAQGYLKWGPEEELRISNRRHLTLKRGSGLVRTEIIIEVDENVYQALWALTEGRRVEKIRHYFKYDKYLIELDEYQGRHKGLITAEIEFSDQESAENFQIPEWLGQDISDEVKYKNSVLATQ